MSLMRSYGFGTTGYGVSELSPEILNLFLPLVQEPGKQIEFASEIITAALDKRIDLTKEFKLDNYERKIRTNGSLFEYTRKSRHKEDSVDFSRSTGDSEDYDALSGDYVTVNAAIKMEDAYASVHDGDELRYAVETIKTMQPVLLLYENLDIIVTIKQALKGVPESIAMIKDLCLRNKVVGELVWIVLNSGDEFATLFG